MNCNFIAGDLEFSGKSRLDYPVRHFCCPAKRSLAVDVGRMRISDGGIYCQWL